MSDVPVLSIPALVKQIQGQSNKNMETPKSGSKKSKDGKKRKSSGSKKKSKISPIAKQNLSLSSEPISLISSDESESQSPKATSQYAAKIPDLKAMSREEFDQYCKDRREQAKKRREQWEKDRASKIDLNQKRIDKIKLQNSDFSKLELTDFTKNDNLSVSTVGAQNYQEQIAVLKNKIKQLELENERAKSRSSNISNADVEKMKSDYEEKIKNLNEKILKLTNFFNDSEKKVSEENIELKARITKLKSENNDIALSVADMETEHKDAVNDLNSQIQKLNSENSDKDVKVAKMEAEHKDVVRDLEESKGKLTTTISNQRKQLSDLMRQQKKFKEDKAADDKSKQRYRSKIDKLEKENSELKQANNKLTKRIEKDAEIDLDKLPEKEARRRKQLLNNYENKHRKVIEQKKIIDDLKSENRRLEGRLVVLDGKYKASSGNKPSNIKNIMYETADLDDNSDLEDSDLSSNRKRSRRESRPSSSGGSSSKRSKRSSVGRSSRRDEFEREPSLNLENKEPELPQNTIVNQPSPALNKNWNLYSDIPLSNVPQRVASNNDPLHTNSKWTDFNVHVNTNNQKTSAKPIQVISPQTRKGPVIEKVYRSSSNSTPNNQARINANLKNFNNLPRPQNLPHRIPQVYDHDQVFNRNQYSVPLNTNTNNWRDNLPGILRMSDSPKSQQPLLSTPPPNLSMSPINVPSSESKQKSKQNKKVVINEPPKEQKLTNMVEQNRGTTGTLQGTNRRGNLRPKAEN